MKKRLPSFIFALFTTYALNAPAEEYRVLIDPFIDPSYKFIVFHISNYENFAVACDMRVVVEYEADGSHIGYRTILLNGVPIEAGKLDYEEEAGNEQITALEQIYHNPKIKKIVLETKQASCRKKSVQIPQKGQIAVGRSHSCALLEDGRVRCWGEGWNGMLGDGDTSIHAVASPKLIENLFHVKQIDLGHSHSCALMEDGRVQCWGDGWAGKLGDGDTSFHSSGIPKFVGGLSNVSQIDLNGAGACALLANGRVQCWGYSFAGVLGDKDPSIHHIGTPKLIEDLFSVRQIALGENHACALMNDGRVKCWGGGWAGQLGDGDTTSHHAVTPKLVEGLSNVKQIALKNDFSCALLYDGRVKCWGKGGGGRLGDGDTSEHNVATPLLIENLSDIKQIALGDSFACALNHGGNVHCWGGGWGGQLGDGRLSSHDVGVPQLVGELSAVRQIDLGFMHGCALLNDGGVKCWGYGEAGALGDGIVLGHGLGVPALIPGFNIKD
jgi:alpha-tubulin suppressor-like RCC1 family protein